VAQHVPLIGVERVDLGRARPIEQPVLVSVNSGVVLPSGTVGLVVVSGKVPGTGLVQTMLSVMPG